MLGPLACVGPLGVGPLAATRFAARRAMRTLIFATLRASSSSLHSVRTPRWYPFGSDSYVARGKPYTSSARCDSIGGGAGERALRDVRRHRASSG